MIKRVTQNLVGAIFMIRQLTALALACVITGSALAADAPRQVTIHWHGQSFFEIESSKGTRIVIDPHAIEAFGRKEVSADVILISHFHSDHTQVEVVKNQARAKILLGLKANGKKVTADEVYFNGELTNKHGGIVVVGDYVYGDSDDLGRPFCAEVKTGKVLWRRKDDQGARQNSASVTYADDRLYFHYQNGVVALVEASPDGYNEVGSFKVKTDGNAWAHPVVVGGRLYLREGDALYCYEVREKQ